MGRVSLSVALLVILAVPLANSLLSSNVALAAPSRSDAVKQAVAGMKISEAEMKAMVSVRSERSCTVSIVRVSVPIRRVIVSA